jgi:hypothetical protein
MTMDHTLLPGFVTSSDDDSLISSRGLSSIRPGSDSSYQTQSSGNYFDLLIRELPEIPLENEQTDEETDRESESTSEIDSESDRRGYLDETYIWTTENDYIVSAAREYTAAFERTFDVINDIVRFDARVEDYSPRFRAFFENTETFRCLEHIQNALTGCENFFKGLRHPDDVDWTEYGHVKRLTEEIHSHIYLASSQIRIGDYLLRRGPSMGERLRMLSGYFGVDARVHSARLLSLVQRVLWV